MNIPWEIHSRGGLAATHELLKSGATSHALTRAVASGAIKRVRQGWYCLPATDFDFERAARVGGRLTCVSAAAHYGLWVSESDELHVRVPPHDSRLRRPDDAKVRLAQHPDSGVRVHWRASRTHGTRFVLLARDALGDMALCQSPERTVAAVDSALRAGHLTIQQWMRDIDRLPTRLRDLLADVDPASESITESMTRFRLRRLGFAPRLQVTIAGVGRVDMMVGRRVIIELDGWAFHQSRDSFEADRRRDALLTALGYRVLRFTYRQVTRAWHEVVAAITAAVSAEGALAA